jgi:hypothetical protein
MFRYLRKRPLVEKATIAAGSITGAITLSGTILESVNHNVTPIAIVVTSGYAIATGVLFTSAAYQKELRIVRRNKDKQIGDAKRN